MPAKFQVTIDCADPGRLSRFWAEALGYELQSPPAGFSSWKEFLEAQNVPEEAWNSGSAIVDPSGIGSRIFFQRVPEPKTVKNRLHFDINASITGTERPSQEEKRQMVDTEVQRLQKLGAAVVQPFEQWGEGWVVMQDPEGNEFCVH